MKTTDIRAAVKAFQDEIQLIVSMLKGKSLRRFHRTLLLAVVPPFAAYYILYVPSQRKLSTLDGDLKAARVAASNSTAYKELKDGLVTAYAKLPLPENRANWLSDTVKEALRAEGIVPTQFMPPSQEEANNAIIQTINITMDVKFSEMMSLLSRLETIRPMLYVTSLSITKKPSESQIGHSEVSCSVSTIILTERY